MSSINYTHTLLSFIIVFFIGLTDCYGQSAKEYNEMAIAKMEQKDYQYALVLIDRAIALNDTSVWYQLRKAEIRFKISGPEKALESVLEALKIDSNNVEVYNRAGEFLESAGMADYAINWYSKGIAKAKDDSTIYRLTMNRGNAKSSKMDFEGAVEDFEKALNFNPNDIYVLNNIATVYDDLGRIDKSLHCLKKIIFLDSTFIGAYINLGFQYSKLEIYDTSLLYFNKALVLDSEFAIIYNNRGYVYYKLKEYSKALADINKSINMYSTNSYAYRNLALVYIAQNKLDEACFALGYANKYGFKKRYGSEVTDLISVYCTKDE